jgi:uncharacterized membrane protein YeaQ/YmgE (transglycosylase-associated protein family)
LRGGENDYMNLLLWIVLGALAGWIASIIMKTNDQQGALMNIVLGIVGALVGGFIMSLFGMEGVTGFNLYSILVSIGGAVLLVWLGKLVLREPRV